MRESEGRFDYYAETLILVLETVMKNNIIKFEDVYRKQISGTVMGKPPAPPWAIIYEEIHEDEYIPEWTTCVKFIKCFIDDGCGFWDPTAEISGEESTIKLMILSQSSTTIKV